MSERQAEKMFSDLPDERSPALMAADERVRALIDDIKQINTKNASLLVRYADKLEENTKEFERKFAELSKQLLQGS